MVKKIISVLVCFGLLFLFSIFLSAQEIMLLKDVQPGMKGYGLTVYEDFKIERFEVEIIGTIYLWISTVETPVILVKLSGGPIGYPVTKTKVVAGMSGSPIFIDNKLIGALAYGFGGIPLDAIAGIQPIELMLNPYVLSSSGYKANLSSAEQLKTLRGLNLNHLNSIPLVLEMPSPFISSLKEKFSRSFPADFNLLNQNFVFSPANAIRNAAPNDFPPLEPGSAISVSLVKGDIDLGAVGTVTAIYRDKIYAFGHQYFNLGQVNFPACPVRILTTFSDQLGSFKISAEKGQEIGVIKEDYFAGIRGVLGKKAEMIPLRVSLEGYRGKREINCRIIRVPELTYLLLRVLAFWNLDDGYKEVESKEFNERSLSAETKIEFKNLPSLKLNHVYNFQPKEEGADVVVRDYTKTLGALTKFLWRKIPFEKHKSFSLRFKFSEKIEPFQIEKILTDKETYQPGETMSISVILSRIKENKKEWYQLENGIKIQIPNNVRLEKGSATVDIEAGSGEAIFSDLPFADKQIDTAKLIENLNNLDNTQLWLKVALPIFDFGVQVDYLIRQLNKWLKEVFLIDLFPNKRSDSSEWRKIQSVKLDTIEPSDTKFVLQRLSLPEGIGKIVINGSASLSVEISWD